MKILNILSILFLLLSMASCNNDIKEAKHFAKSFAYAVNVGDTMLISKMMDISNKYVWKDISMKQIHPDSITINEMGREGQFMVVSNSGIKYIIGKTQYDGDGFFVKSTYNVFLVDANKKNIALSKGLITSNLDDYAIFNVIQSDNFVNLFEELYRQNEENTSQSSVQKRIPSLLKYFEDRIFDIEDCLKQNDRETFFFTTLGHKVVFYAEEARDQLIKYQKYFTEEQQSRYEIANRKLIMYSKKVN